MHFRAQARRRRPVAECVGGDALTTVGDRHRPAGSPVLWLDPSTSNSRTSAEPLTPTGTGIVFAAFATAAPSASFAGVFALTAVIGTAAVAVAPRVAVVPAAVSNRA